MSLADLMRKGGLQRVATATVATPATDGGQNARTVATVAGVAVAKGRESEAASVRAVLTVATVATVAVANTTGSEAETAGVVRTVATVAVANCPDSKAANDAAVGLTVAVVAPVAVASLPDSKAAPAENLDTVPTTAPDPDRWCYPHSNAMTGKEIDRFTGRLVLFMAKGLTANDAEVLADKLLIRDRDGDDRRVCLECSHLSGWNGRRQCRGLQYAGMGGPLVSAGQVAVLQRCNGFKGTAS